MVWQEGGEGSTESIGLSQPPQNRREKHDLTKALALGGPFDLKAELKSENENGIQADFVCLKFFVSKVRASEKRKYHHVENRDDLINHGPRFGAWSIASVLWGLHEHLERNADGSGAKFRSI